MRMRRVLVIGSGGAGKTMLATRLAQRTGLPLIHLDRIYWRPGWVEPPADAWAAQVEGLIAQECWIMDGHFGGTLDRRLAACDGVIFLDLPRWLCLWRVIRRRLRHHRRARPDMTPGCPERRSLDFLWWIWSFPARRRPGILKRLAALHGDQHVVVLRSAAEVARFLDSRGY